MITIFSDFDNTLCPRSDAAAFEKNLAAVKQFRAAGNQFVITTGRSLPSLRRKLPNYAEFCDYLLLNNGAICVDTRKDEIVFCTPLKSRLVDQLVNFTRVLDVNDEFGFVFYTAGEEETPYKIGEVTKLSIWTVTDEATDEFLDAIRRNFKKSVNAFPVYNTFPKGQYWISANNKALIEIVAGDAGKEHGVAKFTQKVFRPDRVVTVGDGPNDIAMLTDFEGYAPVSANAEVLAAVGNGRVVASVAELIGRLL